jgi:hypothetical protein
MHVPCVAYALRGEVRLSLLVAWKFWMCMSSAVPKGTVAIPEFRSLLSDFTCVISSRGL